MLGAYLRPTSALAAAFAVSACVTTKSGPTAEAPECRVGPSAYAIGGAVLGAVIGAAVSKNNRGQGAVIGGVVGGAAGLGAGHFIQERCKALEEARKQMSTVTVAAKEIEVRSPDITWNDPNAAPSEKKIDEGVATILHASAMFESGSAELTPAAAQDMQALAKAYSGTKNKLLIVGHTDSSGNPEANLALSERRALRVARIFEDAGIPRDNIYYKGAGETQPVADNATEPGRALNRRVEVIELETETGILAYGAKQDADPGYMQRATKGQETKTVALPPSPPASPAPTPPAPSARPAQPSPPAAEKPAGDAKFASALKPGTLLDFGGSPVSGSGVPVAEVVGDKAPTGWLSNLSFISKAFAAPAETAFTQTSCLADPNRRSGVTRSLATGQVVSRRISEYMPGLYGTTWTQTLNGHLTGLADVKVLREAATVDDPAQVVVFKDFKDGDQVPTLAIKPSVRSFEGQGGVLYRMFLAEDAWPLRCIDVVFDAGGQGKTKFGRLYYDKAGLVHVVDYTPSLSSVGRK